VGVLADAPPDAVAIRPTPEPSDATLTALAEFTSTGSLPPDAPSLNQLYRLSAALRHAALRDAVEVRLGGLLALASPQPAPVPAPPPPPPSGLTTAEYMSGSWRAGYVSGDSLGAAGLPPAGVAALGSRTAVLNALHQSQCLPDPFRIAGSTSAAY